MSAMSLTEFIETLNEWGSQQIPFLFLVDFEMRQPMAFPLSQIDPDQLLYNFNGVTNAQVSVSGPGPIEFNKRPVSLEEYKKKFDTVMKRLSYGDSYLTNLTLKTRIEGNVKLKDLFFVSKAKYKLWFRDEFLVFSPEIFIQIKEGKIFSYPMKGTIDASVSRAREKILSDSKELAEHVTIVDLIRNDLSLIADHVKVTRFRYIEELFTNDKKLLQVSSEITGDLLAPGQLKLGSLLIKLLPAGSVSGAPKRKTVEIIRQAEGEDRGFYTGVFGIFDGQNFDSGVMIRFIEQQKGELYYRSGGGITTQSILENEYQEAIDKVYVPVD